MTPRRKRPTLAAAAGRGALAGLAGGLALTLADRVLAPRVAGTTPRGRRFDQRLARSARAVGMKVPRRRQEAAGIAATIAGATLLGAAYGVARATMGRSSMGRAAADAALAYGATLLLPEQAGRRRSARAVTPQGVVVRRLGHPKLFERVTTTAFRLLAR
jgi:hypothetical protein